MLLLSSRWAAYLSCINKNRMFPVAVAFVLEMLLSICSGEYFHRYDNGSSTIFSIAKLESLLTRSVIECSRECIVTSGCVSMCFDDVTNTCILGSDDESTGVSMDVDVSVGKWSIYKAEGYSVTRLYTTVTTPNYSTATSLVILSLS